MQLWSGVLSPFSAKVRVVLAEKGLSAEILEVPWSRKTLWGPKPAEFLAVSPLGKVPVLLDGDLAIYDSTVIDEYLEEQYPELPLMPAEPAANLERGTSSSRSAPRAWQNSFCRWSSHNARPDSATSRLHSLRPRLSAAAIR